MAFVETFSLYLLHDLPWKAADAEVKKIFEELWGLLRDGVLYFMRYEDGQHTWDRILDAQKSLLQYGKRAEQVWNLLGSMHTLHHTQTTVMHADSCLNQH